METKFTPLDFSKSSDQAYAEKCFGGKDNWKNSHPLLFTAYEKAQTARSRPNEGLSNEADVACANWALIYDLVQRRDKRILCGSAITLTKPASEMHVVLEVYRNDALIGRSLTTKSDIQICVLDCVTSPQDIRRGDEVHARFICFYNDADSLKAGYISRELKLEPGSAVSSVICIDPNKQPRCKAYPGTIAVSYDRGFSKTEVDYPEIEGRMPGRPQFVFLEGNGRVTLNPGYTFVEYRSHDLALISKELGVIIYKGTRPVLTPDPSKTSFTWAFDRKWNDAIPDRARHGLATFYYCLNLAFKCKDPRGNIIEQSIEVTSLLDRNPPPDIAAIFPLLFFWRAPGNEE
jgi:hypothetical protein